MGSKVCIKCNVCKYLDDFHKNVESKDGRVTRCKPCVKAYAAKWNKDTSVERKAVRERNKLAIQARRKKYYLENKEEINSTNRLWAINNPDCQRKSSAKYRAENPDKMKEFRNKWKSANPDKIAADAAKRRAVKFKATPNWADQEKIAIIYAEAATKTRSHGIEYHVDHIVPLRSKLVCGLHNEFNLQVMIGTENQAKSNRHWPDMP